jgi:uncharacterized protein (TIGR03086 family)
MSEVVTRYGTIAAGFTTRVEGVGADGWSAPTPCTDWNVAALVAHVVGVHRRVIATLDGTEPEAVDEHGDLFTQWVAATAAVSNALGDDVRASKVIGGMFGEQPFEQLVGRLVCTDTLVHTWDLARATGQDENLDSDAAAKSLEFLTPIDEAIRRPGGFAPKINSAEGADNLTKLLHFCGRST